MMKSIHSNIPSRASGHNFGIGKQDVPEGIELGEHIILENEDFLGHAIVTGLFLSGSIMVELSSRKEHPQKTLTRAIQVLENNPRTPTNSTIINLFGNTLHDWKDGRINTRAVELVATLAEEILEKAEDNNEDTDY